MPGIFDGELTSVTLCWTLERPDGGGVAMVGHDRPLVIDGIKHAPSPGIVPAAVTRSLGLESHSAEVEGALSADAISEGDLLLGRWNGAKARLTAVDWSKPNLDAVTLVVGDIGTVSIKDDGFSADLHGAASKLDQPVCPSTSPRCRARFGDKQCRIDLAGRTITVTVTGLSSNELTVDQAIDDKFLLGRLRYLSGPNCGLSTIITAISGSQLTIRDLPRGALGLGDKVELREGCDKSFGTCVGRFANAVNFRGEPHLPGTDALTRYPGV